MKTAEIRQSVENCLLWLLNKVSRTRDWCMECGGKKTTVTSHRPRPGEKRMPHQSNKDMPDSVFRCPGCELKKFIW